MADLRDHCDDSRPRYPAPGPESDSLAAGPVVARARAPASAAAQVAGRAEYSRSARTNCRRCDVSLLVFLACGTDLRALVATHHPCLRQHVSFDRRVEIVAGITGQFEGRHVERKDRDVVAMGAVAVWRAGPTVAFTTETVPERLASSGLQFRCGGGHVV